MVDPGQTLINPVTGEQMTFVRTSADTGSAPHSQSARPSDTHWATGRRTSPNSHSGPVTATP
jgi:hypothetical protein